MFTERLRCVITASFIQERMFKEKQIGTIKNYQLHTAQRKEVPLYTNHTLALTEV